MYLYAGWLIPLLSRIAENRKNVVCPVIDNIKAENLEYPGSLKTSVGSFDWGLVFRWKSSKPYNHYYVDNKISLKAVRMA